MQEYVNKHGLVAKYDALALGPEHDPLRQSYDSARETELTLTYLNVDIFREVSWTLSNQILEQLQSIVIPLSDINRYLDNIERFHSLVSVTFKMDNLGVFQDDRLDRMNQCDLHKAGQWMEKRRQDLETAVQFVQHHTTTFPGTLREVLVPTDLSWCYNRQTCPASYGMRMLDLVRSLHDPEELNQQNVAQFAAKIEKTNVEKVHAIDIHRLGDDWYDKLRSTPFLYRCRSLRRYSMMTLGPESFKWVLDMNREQDVPPLEEISIWASKLPLDNELNDIGRGLGGALKFFRIRGFHQLPQGLDVIPPIRIGHEWRLPFLTHLIVKATKERLLLDPELLCHCPSLRVVSLSDQPRWPVVVIGLQMCQPARLPRLTHLQLGGSAAVCFHPDSLHSTKELLVLVLGGPEGLDRVPQHSLRELQAEGQLAEQTESEESSGPSPVPSVDWSWDWHFPILVTLDIHTEFALRFQFQMLEKTPSLQELCLSIYSSEVMESRELNGRDFLIDPAPGIDPADSVTDGAQDLCFESTSISEPGDDCNFWTQPVSTLRRILDYLQHVQQYEEHTPITLCTLGSNPEYCTIFLRSCARNRQRRQDVCFSPPSRLNDRQTAARQEVDQEQARVEAIQDIEDLVWDDPKLETHLEALTQQQLLHEQRLKQCRKVTEDLSLIKVPSRRKLDLYGAWVIPDKILLIILGVIFRNLDTLTMSDCCGFSMESLVAATQLMPRMELVHILSQFEPGPSLGDHFKLKLYDGRPISPFETDSASRVVPVCRADLWVRWAGLHPGC